MKGKLQTIKPLSSTDFRAMAYLENAPVALPDVDDYLADMLKHF